MKTNIHHFSLPVLAACLLTQIAMGSTFFYTSGTVFEDNGDNGQANTYIVELEGIATFATDYGSSSFESRAPINGFVPTVGFRVGDALSDTMANSVTVSEGAGIDLQFMGDSEGEIVAAVYVGDVTLQNGTYFAFDLFSTNTIPIIMDLGELTLEQSFSNQITFTLDNFADALEAGESRTYTIIGSVGTLDLDGQTDILSKLVFDNGANNNITGVFSGLNPSGDPNLYLELTNTVPEPSTTVLGFGVLMLVVLNLRRWRKRGLC